MTNLAEQIHRLLEEVTKSQLDRIEKSIDKLFAVLNIDVEFTNHFHDRLNDVRNGKPITIDELAEMFADVFKTHGKRIANMKDDAEAILNDVRSDVNIPFVIEKNKEGMLELISKTVMRKKDFKAREKKLKVG